METNDGLRMLHRAQTRETAADRMARLHQEQEQRAGRDKDRVGQAAGHNETYPKMRRELARRRSLAEVPDRPVRQALISNHSVPRRRGKYQRKTPKRTTSRARRAKYRARVSKPRDKRPCTCSKCLRLKRPICRAQIENFCVYVTNKRIGTETLCALEISENEPDGEVSRPDRSPARSDGIHTPKSEIPSASSYNSFPSLNHEPMVSSEKLQSKRSASGKNYRHAS